MCHVFRLVHLNSLCGVNVYAEWGGGAENAGVENAGAITRRNPSEEKTNTPVFKLKRIGLVQAVNSAHEER